MVDYMVVVLMYLSMVKSSMVSMVFVSWELMSLSPSMGEMGIGFEKQNYPL